MAVRGDRLEHLAGTADIGGTWGNRVTEPIKELGLGAGAALCRRLPAGGVMGHPRRPLSQTRSTPIAGMLLSKSGLVPSASRGILTFRSTSRNSGSPWSYLSRSSSAAFHAPWTRR